MANYVHWWHFYGAALRAAPEASIQGDLYDKYEIKYCIKDVTCSVFLIYGLCNNSPRYFVTKGPLYYLQPFFIHPATLGV